MELGWVLRVDTCFKMYMGYCFFFLGVARPAHQETIAIEKIVCYPQFPRGGGHVPLCRAMWGNTRKQEEKARADAFTVASEGRNG